MKTYEVYLRYEGRNTYIVDAENEEDAKEKAKHRYWNGDNGTSVGNEWEEITNLDVNEELIK